MRRQRIESLARRIVRAPNPGAVFFRMPGERRLRDLFHPEQTHTESEIRRRYGGLAPITEWYPRYPEPGTLTLEEFATVVRGVGIWMILGRPPGETRKIVELKTRLFRAQ